MCDEEFVLISPHIVLYNVQCTTFIIHVKLNFDG